MGSVVSILVAIDECTTESGCLWIADGVDELLPTDERGVVTVEAVVVGPVDSGGARSRRRALHRRPRTALQRGEQEHRRTKGAGGELRAGERELRPGPLLLGQERRHGRAASLRDGQFRISTLADFEGVEVPSQGPVAVGSCTHH